MQVNHKENIIEIENLLFYYGKETVLKDINLKIHKGDYIGIAGPNGGGKTTLLKCILGLLKPQKGTIRLFGVNIRSFKNWSKIGYVPQKITFDPYFPATVKEVVSMGLYGKKGLFRPLGKEDWKNVRTALEQVGMHNISQRRIGELSGGQQQRVFIARALVSKPEVIFLDEPTVGVDIETRNQFFSLVETLNKKLELTLVLVTHDIDILLHHGATEAAFINKEILFYGKPRDLLKTKYIDEHYKKHY
jgi:zinc transport system ATP-binding protein